jgi:transglutaminase-like putative cysteine protease
MLFRITHSTRFVYDRPAYDSHNELRLRPLDSEDQRCLAFELSLDRPAAVLAYRDFFGNHAHSVSVSVPHAALTVVACSLVERAPIAPASLPEATFASFLAEDRARAQVYCEFVGPSQYVPFSERLRKFFWMVHPSRGEDVATYAARIVAWVRDQFEYEKARTHVHSSLDDILKSGGGVCQDFAHLTIGVLRLAGVPARYVSGYLAPALAAGGPAAIGEQASHAWLEAWLPGAGWIGFDPTHRNRTGAYHIRVAVGRDYGDVPPLRGMYRSHGIGQVMKVELNVETADAAGAPNAGSSQQGFQNQQ